VRVRILGSGAGGGFPQWNCNCANCRGYRAGTLKASPRTQSSIAVACPSGGWVLINASPDLRQQIGAFSELQPDADGPPRGTPIRAIVLTNADIDHIAGLLTVRESEPLCLYSTPTVRSCVLERNAAFRAICLGPTQCAFRPLVVGGPPEEIIGVGDRPTGIQLEAFAVPGKTPAYLEGSAPSSAEETVGLILSLRDGVGGGGLAYVPGVKALAPDLLARLSRCRTLLIDGTCWSNDELEQRGVGRKTSLAMGHLPIGGEAGSLSLLGREPSVRGVRTIYIHINNTNPILDQESPERRRVVDAGFEVAFDGMELEV
jgi:pyrroloquinoline quinone biosynthesis protein B